MTDAETEDLIQFSAESRERLRTSAAALTAALEHTGTFPAAIEHREDDDDDEPDEADTSLAVSVLSRWDLDITDAAALDHDEPPAAPDGQILFSESW